MEKNILPLIISKNEIKSNTNVNAALLGKFENSLLVIKLFILFVLIIASAINKDLNFGANSNLTDNKYKIQFIIETIIVGMGCAIPILYMKWMRDPTNATVYNMSILFIFSFIFMGSLNVLFQFSGFYSFMYGIKQVPESQPNIKKGIIKSILLSVGIIIAILIMQILIISMIIQNNDIPAYSNNLLLWFILEMLIFAFAISLPSLLITFNRIGNVNISSVYALFLFVTGFAILHGVLQNAGFYKHLLGI
jgi:Na+-driven multidrug efflux pump